MQWEWFLATFSVLSMMYRSIILLTGISKIQIAFGIARLKNADGVELQSTSPYLDKRYYNFLKFLCLHRRSTAFY